MPMPKRLATRLSKQHAISTVAIKDAKDAVTDAVLSALLTASPTPIVLGEWIKKERILMLWVLAHRYREFDTAAVVNSKLYTDQYESIYMKLVILLFLKRRSHRR